VSEPFREEGNFYKLHPLATLRTKQRVFPSEGNLAYLLGRKTKHIFHPPQDTRNNLLQMSPHSIG